MSLSNLRVLDLSMGWAGPFVSFILAELGAEVIKVEARQRFDWWRGPPPRDRAGSDIPFPHEASAVYNSVNRHKQGVTLDLTSAGGRAALLDLVRVSDLLVENFTPHAMEALALTYPALAAVNPQVIMVSMPGFGATGPERDYIGYGMTIEALSGMTALTGYVDGPPQMLSNAYGDPVSGLNGAVAALTALRGRDRTGRGCNVEVAQVEGFIPMVAGALIEQQMSGRNRPRMGNRHLSMAPHGVYACGSETDLTPRPPSLRGKGESSATSVGKDSPPLAGEGPGERSESWVAIAVGTDAEWASLCRAIGRPELACDPRFADVVSRKRNERDIDPLLGAWTARRSRETVVADLRAAAVPVAPVQTSADLLADVQLAARGFFTVVERAHVGTHPYPGLPFSVKPPPHPDALPAPCLGEHSEPVLTDLLGMSGDVYHSLVAAGVTGTVPLG
jgi:crotonobetainyl-CoA:carnitine CoA-transferase CaiB-like acyl-CoA transferase